MSGDSTSARADHSGSRRSTPRRSSSVPRPPSSTTTPPSSRNPSKGDAITGRSVRPDRPGRRPGPVRLRGDDRLRPRPRAAHRAAGRLGRAGVPREAGLTQLWKRAATYDGCPTSPALRERLEAELPLGVEVLDERDRRSGRDAQGAAPARRPHVVEAVLMGYRDRVTVCVSTQAGCAMGCGFCATGQMGLQNNLTAGEIAAQAVWARREAARLPDTTPRRLTQRRVHGDGRAARERAPHVRGARRLTDPGAFGLGARHVTVSTVGLVPGIRRLGERPPAGRARGEPPRGDRRAPRSELVPPNRLWPLAELEDAIAGLARRPPIAGRRSSGR